VECLLSATTLGLEGYKKEKQATRLSPAYHQPKSKSRSLMTSHATERCPRTIFLLVETLASKGFDKLLRVFSMV
jgi:hypothetical protein